MLNRSRFPLPEPGPESAQLLSLVRRTLESAIAPIIPAQQTTHQSIPQGLTDVQQAKMDFVDDAAASAAAADDMGEWEWPSHCDELREMENLLRCQICGDFFHGPVLLPCSHAFCSECVRKYLQTKGAHGCCPECKQACAPRDLVANRSMEKVALLFKQMKPKLLLMLDKKAGSEQVAEGKSGSTTRSTRSQNAKDSAATLAITSGKNAANGKGRAVERMPVVSYNVMKDKEIRKLLEPINIRLPLKNRDEIIQIHKEYVLLFNAQIDSCNPKSAAKLRDEVIRNHKLRQQEKHQAEIAKKHTSASPTASLTAQMKANFERLKQEIAERKANPQRAAAASAAASQAADDDGGVPPEAVINPSLGLSSASVGIWRHVYSHNQKKEFYINSVTREIRLERPPEFVQQQNPKNRYDDDEDNGGDVFLTDSGNHSVDLTEDADVKPVSRRLSLQAPVSPNDGGDFEIVEPPRSAVKAPTPSHLHGGKAKRPASFFSADVSAATQDFSFSSDDEDVNGVTTTQSHTVMSASVSEELSASVSVSSTTAVSTAAGSTEDTKWDCPRCTLVNETSSNLCEACGYESKQQPARKRQKKMQFQSKISMG